MLINSAKLLKKSLAALMLTSVLSLASCGTVRKTTTTNDLHRRTIECVADSIGAETTATQNAKREQVDSLFQATLKQLINQESEVSLDQTLHLLLFDTTQPADTVTGLPPVKAALTKTTATKRKETTQSTTQADVKAEQTREKTDSTQTVAQSAAHVQSDTKESVADKSESHTQQTTQHNGWKVWAVLILVASLVIAVCLCYLRRKVKH